jgi:hypothetical protein
MATPAPAVLAYKDLIQFLAEERIAGTPTTDAMDAVDAETILEEFSECPRNAEGWKDALIANDGEALIRAIKKFAADLAETDVERAADQIACERGEAQFEEHLSEPVNHAVPFGNLTHGEYAVLLRNGGVLRAPLSVSPELKLQRASLPVIRPSPSCERSKRTSTRAPITLLPVRSNGCSARRTLSSQLAQP